MGEVVEAFLGRFVCGLEVMGDVVEGLADPGVVATEHCCASGERKGGEAVVCDGVYVMNHHSDVGWRRKRRALEER